MAYRLKKGRKLNRSLKQAVSSQLAGAIRQILTAGPGNPEGVHQVRKHLKKTRAALRLIRTALDERYEPQNRAMRDAARRLSVWRDDEILLGTFDRITAPLSPEEQERLAPVRARLFERKAAAISVRASDRMYALIMLFRLKAAVRRWPAVGHGTISKGWKKGFQRARQGWQAVEQDADPLRVHEWRKRVKTHWYHTRLLQPFVPEEFRGRREDLRKLSILLGHFHDLTVFRGQLAFQPEVFGTPKQAETLHGLAEAEQSRLLAEALPVGRKMFGHESARLRDGLDRVCCN